MSTDFCYVGTYSTHFPWLEYDPTAQGHLLLKWINFPEIERERERISLCIVK